MILAAQHIRRRCKYPRPEDPLIMPFCEKSSIRGMTYGLSAASYDIRIAQSVVVPAKGFVLASTLEYFSMHKDLSAIVHDKSTWARRGIAVQNTLFDPGWCGFATLELSNHSAEDIEILEGDPIAQLMFHLLIDRTESPYEGKYQNQRAGPVGAILDDSSSSSASASASTAEMRELSSRIRSTGWW